MKRKIINIAGKNAGIARLLLNKTIEARTAELNNPNFKRKPHSVIHSHRLELQKYRAWKNILNNTGSQMPSRAAFAVTKNTFQPYFKINQELLTKIVNHTHRSNNERSIIQKHKQLFNSAKLRRLTEAVNTARRSYNALERQTPGTPAYTRALERFEANVSKANNASRR
jgi:hypothetical protein